jgi:hypothetical protein
MRVTASPMTAGAIKSAYLSQIGRKGGTVRSGEKAQASAENGKKGGAPRKYMVEIIDEDGEHTVEPSARKPNRRKGRKYRVFAGRKRMPITATGKVYNVETE